MKTFSFPENGIFSGNAFTRTKHSLKHKNAERNQYNFIVERVINRLAGWKSKFLSFAGRTVLVKSVMSAMPNHVMQGVTLPSHLCEKLDKINRDFLWGYSTDGKKKMHLVGWNKIIKPKEQGGLGIQSAKEKKYCSPC